MKITNLEVWRKPSISAEHDTTAKHYKTIGIDQEYVNVRACFDEGKINPLTDIIEIVRNGKFLQYGIPKQNFDQAGPTVDVEIPAEECDLQFVLKSNGGIALVQTFQIQAVPTVYTQYKGVPLERV